MKILLSNPPWHDIKNESGWIGVRAGSRWPHTLEYMGSMISPYLPFPFYLATAYSLIKKEGLNVSILDSIALGQTYNEFYNSFKEYKPDILVMETSTPSLYNDLIIASTIKKISNGKTKIIFCGIHNELESINFLKEYGDVDFTVYGEYEYPLVKLLNAIKQEAGFRDLTNITYRKENGKIEKKERGKLVDIDKMQWPERSKLPKVYSDSFCGLDAPQLQVHTSRGCTYGCIFCAWPQIMYGGSQYRRRKPEDVINEILFNLKKFPYKSINIDDDTFNINKDHVLEFCRLFKKNGLDKIRWGTMGRADLMDREMLLALKDAGLYAIKYGVETLDENVLKNIGKNMNLQKNIENIRLTKELGIKVHLTFCLGLPGDTKETIEKTIDEAMKLPFDTIQFSIATPYPGCKMYEIYDKNKWIITKEWDKYNGSASSIISTDNLSAKELEEYYKIAVQRSKEKHVIENINTPEFKRKFKLIFSKHNKKDKVIIFQSAIISLTKEIIRQAKDMDIDIHVLSNRAYSEEFFQLIPQNKIHIFRKGMNFNFQNMRLQISELQALYNFKKVIIPYSNSDCIGYDNVHEVANAFNTEILRVTKDGNIIESER
ncbi:B12-binding domain-containing radical SAM protein [Paramaledivibacter caminithermalis]|uniref:Radical SAM superfamily enzyme YgiQ, UPF0313 family n=1 Tax=Paramaledivibacter caminithermalis (strain DSM 15212 / CIP 107654 / DViRD3) TaxID=1121301 RepID=A0A1M6L6E0_PARC5|nr:radical SAM protein [Paramaledivibacter caminithermalis]SHJ66783.1 Radical SAM superfamily enzyme YgiQ, UPF0313 family [Paramaledivibacter caminithermalis DSM 15212]